jgi:3-dehydroshikimate dehydratase
MKTSIATVSLSGTLEEKLQAVAKAGFSGVEIFENDFLVSEASAADIRRMTADLGLVITLYQPFRDFEGLPAAERSLSFDRAERKFDVMHQMGADMMLVCSNCSPNALGGIDRAADDFAALGERAAARGIRIGYEAWSGRNGTSRDSRRRRRPPVLLG